MNQHTRLIVDAITAYLERPSQRAQPMTDTALEAAYSSAAAKAGDLSEAEYLTAVDEAEQLLPAIAPGITRSRYADAIRQTVGGEA